MGEDTRTRFVEFYRANYSLILSTCYRRLGDRPSAEDATAEAFRVAWTSFRNGGEPSLPWLYGVARNIIGNAYRSRTRAAALEAAAEEAVRNLPDAPTDDGREVRAAMKRLREADRELLFMTYWEDLSGAEVAEILGCKVDTVWVRLSRAREALRRELERERTGV